MYTWLIAIPVTILLLWVVWRSPNRQRLVWRMMTSAVAGISLVLLVFPPTIQQAINPSTAILLTEGYDQNTLEALLQQQDAQPSIYVLGTKARKATPLSNLHTLRNQQPSLQQVHLLGYGLEKEQLKALKGVHVIPHLTDTPTGLKTVQWTQQARLGQKVSVSGKYQSAALPVWLYLQAAGQTRDSIEVKPNSTQPINLTYAPKQTGHFTYTLTTKAGGDSIPYTVGQLPVQVIPHQTLRVLLLASAPSFEFKFLKNHLTEQHHQVAYRATVSKGFNQSEWVNMPEISLSNINAKLLQSFDVVVTEPQALQNLSAAERNVLQRAVTAEGLGILTIASEPNSNRSLSFFTGFQSKRASQEPIRNTRASWEGVYQAPVSAAPYALVSNAEVTRLVTEQNERLLAGVKRAGWGKVSLSYLPQTFPWQIAGNSKLYASYWASVLSAITKEEVKEKFWQLEDPQFPKQQRPVVLSFTDYTSSEDLAVPKATISNLADSTSTSLALAQNLHQPEKYSATFWPENSGWYQANIPDMEPYFFYVHPANTWVHEDIKAKARATLDFVANQQKQKVTDNIAYVQEPIAGIWFFLLFVLSSGFLWLEEKF